MLPNQSCWSDLRKLRSKSQHLPETFEFGTLLECFSENHYLAGFHSLAADFNTSFLILESLPEDLNLI